MIMLLEYLLSMLMIGALAKYYTLKLDDLGVPMIKERDSKCDPALFENIIDPEVCLDMVDQFKTEGLNKLVPLGERQFALLLSYYSELHTVPFDPLMAKPLGMKRLASMLSAKNAQYFQFPIFVHFIPFATAQVLAAMDIDKLLEWSDGDTSILLINKIAGGLETGKKSLIDNNQVIFKHLDEKLVKLHELSEVAVELLMRNAEGCQDLTSFLLNSQSEKAKFAALLTPQCLSFVQDLHLHPCTIGIRNWPTFLFKKLKGLNRSCRKFLTASQIASMSSEIPIDEQPCSNMELTSDLMINGGEMTPECFAGALMAAALKGEYTLLEQAWSILPNNILSKVKDPDALEMLNKEWQFIPLNIKQVLFDDPDLCSVLPLEIFSYHASVTITDRCFSNLSTRHQVEAILKSNLDRNVFNYVDYDMVEGWEHDGLVGLQILDKAFYKPSSLPLIIKSLGSKVDGKVHPCALFTSFSDLQAAVAIQMYAKKSCFETMRIDFKEAVSKDQLETLDKHAQQLINQIIDKEKV